MSNSKKYFWLKLKDNFFNQKEIKKLRRIAGGDTYTIIYLKLQLLSIKKEGVIEFEGTEENLAEQLALEIDEDKDNIEITLRFLQANHLIEEMFEDSYLLTKVPECIGKECDSAERVRKHREKLKQSNLLQSNTNTLQCNTLVTSSNTEIEIEKEKEKEKEKDTEKNREISKLCKDVIEYLNEKAGTRYKHNSDKTKDLIKARVNEGYEYYDFTTVIDIKCAEWLNTNMSKYLRPITLFSNKFESYLNQGTSKNNNQQSYNDMLSKIDF